MAPHQPVLTSFFWSGDAIRSRSVGRTVLADTLEIPLPPARLLADWERDISHNLGLESGDVEALPLARARVRWPDYTRCVQAVATWTLMPGLEDLMGDCDVALMACRGARYHHDGAQYGAAAFCNLFLSEDKGLDLHFPDINLRIPLVRGTVVVFDTGLAHAVIARESSGFSAADFPPECDCSLVFLTWELPIESAHVGRALGVVYDADMLTAQRLEEEQIWLNGAPSQLCPDSGIRTKASQ